MKTQCSLVPFTALTVESFVRHEHRDFKHGKHPRGRPPKVLLSYLTEEKDRFLEVS